MNSRPITPYEAFDILLMSKVKPPGPGVLQDCAETRCPTGDHLPGFVCCPACGRINMTAKDRVDRLWLRLDEGTRATLIDGCRTALEAMGDALRHATDVLNPYGGLTPPDVRTPGPQKASGGNDSVASLPDAWSAANDGENWWK